MPMNRELELKATIRPEHLDRLKNLPAIKSRVTGRARSRRLVTIYFDTPDHALRRQGVSLRVRKIGSAYVQCVKRTKRRLGGSTVREEWEGPVPDQTPAISVIEDKGLRRRIRRAGVKRLQPVFRTEIQRSSQTLRFDDDSSATLDIDVGEVIADEASEPICEFELELLGGAAEHIFNLASEIRKTIPFRLALPSKAARGYALTAKGDPRSASRVKPDIAKDSTIERVLAALVQDCLDHLQTNEPVALATDDTEGVHQMRVALRRLRAALRLFKPFLPADQYTWVVAEARWLGGELSAARAWDVFANELLAPVVRLYGEDPGFDELSAATEQAREQSRRRVRDAIESERYTEFLLRLSAWLSGQAWRDQPVSEQTVRLLDPIGDHCAALLQRRDRIVRKLAGNIDNQSDAGVHELRLAVKKLRYTVEFFGILYPGKPAKIYRKRLASLQDRLGYLNDVVGATTLVGELGDRDERMSSSWAHAAGLTLGWHRQAMAAAREKLGEDVAGFLRTRPFWRGG